MIPLVIIRPQPGCDATVDAAREHGVEAYGLPLFEVRPLGWEAPDADSFDALLIGSANALRHGGPAIAAFAGRAAYAVGEKTAQACRDAGMDVVAVGQGGLQDVLSRLDPAHRRLLRLAGATRVPLDPPAGVTITERIVYASEPLAMPDPLAEILREPAVIALHSAEAARHLREQCDARALDRGRLSLAVIGARVADAAGEGWAAVRIAAAPSEAALLALAGEMCKETVQSPQSPGSATPPAPMQNEPEQQPMAAIAPAPKRRRSARWAILLALLAFALGVAGTVWLTSRGYLESIGLIAASPTPDATNGSVDAPANGQLSALAPGEKGAGDTAALRNAEARLAMLEDRLSRLDLQASAASGNATRAESLLIAFAARRMIDRGEPLRYLADQLQLRFANSQPRAVRTIIEFAKDPVTMDQLVTRLEALSPQLSLSSHDDSFLDRAINDLNNLFTVRRQTSKVGNPNAGIDRARIMLRSGRIDEAVEQVRRLPGADAAATWIVDAQRYAEVQRALDLIETTAMLERRRLQDAEGKPLDQASPLAPPAAARD